VGVGYCQKKRRKVSRITSIFNKRYKDNYRSLCAKLKYPLKTKKLADYILFKKAFNLILAKEHLTTEGLRKVVSIRASINKGLSDELKAAFPNTIPTPRPEVEESLINHP